MTVLLWHLAWYHRISHKKLSYRWQTARRLCATCNGVSDPLKINQTNNQGLISGNKAHTW